MKKCTRCKEDLPLEAFGKDKYSHDGLTHQCKICRRKSSAIWKSKNEKRVKEKNKEWRLNNPEKLLKNMEKFNKEHPNYQQEYLSKPENKERHDQNRRNWYEKNKTEICQNIAKRIENDINFKIKKNMRTRLYHILKKEWRAGSAVSDLGCSVEELKIHLEKQFYSNPETGETMSWDNWKYDGWHIDHIKPLASFNLENREEFLKACHYTNLQPLWAKENLSKSDKILEIAP